MPQARSVTGATWTTGSPSTPAGPGGAWCAGTSARSSTASRSPTAATCAARAAPSPRPDAPTSPGAALQDLLRDAHRRGFREVYFSGGEPTLWRDGERGLDDAVLLARRLGFYHVHVYTNGTQGLVTPADLVWVSMDGLPATFERRRGDHFAEVEAAIRAPGHPPAAVLYVIDRHTRDGVEPFLRWVRDTRLPVLGVMFYVHTPYYGYDELFLDARERAGAIDRLLGCLDERLPVLNSRAGLLRAALRPVGAAHAGGRGRRRGRRVGVLPGAGLVLCRLRLRRLHRDRGGAPPAAQRRARHDEVLVSAAGRGASRARHAARCAATWSARRSRGCSARRRRATCRPAGADLPVPARAVLSQRVPVLPVHQGRLPPRARARVAGGGAGGGRVVGAGRRAGGGDQRLHRRRHAHARPRRRGRRARAPAQPVPRDRRRVRGDQPGRRGPRPRPSPARGRRDHGVARRAVVLRAPPATIGRRYSPAVAEAALDRLAAGGFSAVNADLMFALPGQTAGDVVADLGHAAALGADQVTTYPLFTFPYSDVGRYLRLRGVRLPDLARAPGALPCDLRLGPRGGLRARLRLGLPPRLRAALLVGDARRLHRHRPGRGLAPAGRLRARHVRPRRVAGRLPLRPRRARAAPAVHRADERLVVAVLARLRHADPRRPAWSRCSGRTPPRRGAGCGPWRPPRWCAAAAASGSSRTRARSGCTSPRTTSPSPTWTGCGRPAAASPGRRPCQL